MRLASPVRPATDDRGSRLGSRRVLCSPGTPDLFKEILDPNITMVVWERDPNPDLVQALASLDLQREIRAPLQRPDATGQIASLLAAAGAATQGLSAWIQDLAGLANRFADLVDRLPAPHPITLRIETLSDDGCRRFHVDRSRLRLLCTYRGPGTEWLSEEQVDRAALYSHFPNERILKQGRPRRLEPFWVAVMKGESYPGDVGQVHRSPEIAGTGVSRLLFCLDALW